MTGQDERQRLLRTAQLVPLRDCAALAVLVFRFERCSQLHPAPFLLVEHAVGITVETLQQTGKIALPVTDNLSPGRVEIKPLAPTTTGAKVADGIQRFTFVQALLGIAIALAASKQAQPAARRLRGSARRLWERRAIQG